MKKIDIITIHRNCNYGSVLQTYATQNIFIDHGYDVEIIDYIRDQDTIEGQLNRLKNKSSRIHNPFLLLGAKLIMLPSYIKKKIVFDRFIRENIKVTPKKYYSNEQLITEEFDAQAFCTGSDQIWNSLWNEGIIKAYYLDFVPDNRVRFSYASSMGKKEINSAEAETIRPMINKYDLISVRETASINILHKIDYERVRRVLDPTLYLSERKWEAIASSKYKGKRYIVTYNLHHDKRLDTFVKKLSKEKDLSVINISYNWHDIVRKGHLAWCPKVEEYLDLIRNAEYVVADSFHATVFSIQFRKKFLIFYPEESSIRIRDLLETTGLQERGVELGEIRLIDSPIDYNRVHSIIQELRKQDEEYIQAVTQCINNNERGQ